jgi:hypothetical protein
MQPRVLPPRSARQPGKPGPRDALFAQLAEECGLEDAWRPQVSAAFPAAQSPTPSFHFRLGRAAPMAQWPGKGSVADPTVHVGFLLPQAVLSFLSTGNRLCTGFTLPNPPTLNTVPPSPPPRSSFCMN